jgi:alcohol dehydrogenase
MKALVYGGPGRKSWEQVPDPEMSDDRDAIVRVDAVEAVGVPGTFELAVKLARPGGRIANVGVHGKPATLHLEEQWARDITITTGLVDANSTPTLLRLLASHQIDTSRFITHRFGLGEFAEAYDVFARAGDTGALKVVLSN